MAEQLECPVCAGRENKRGPYRTSGTVPAGVKLEFRFYEKAIEVRGCQDCDGIWLEEGQMSEIINVGENDYSHVHAVDIVRRHRSTRAIHEMGDQEVSIHCPRCVDAMVPTTFKSSNVGYHVCMKCGGAWVVEQSLRDIEAYWENK